ncbi:MAG: hypothetical protein Q9159_000766 [Coniocarpon cinnabarinum]
MDAIIDNRISPQTEASSEPPPSLLVLVLDTSPLPWHILSQSPYSLPLIPTAISQLLLFINAHLALSQENRIAVLAAHCGRTHWLYPACSAPGPLSTESNNSHDDELPNDSTAVPTDANKYRPFAILEHTILTRLSALLASTTASDVPTHESQDDYETPLAGTLTLALAYINRTLTSLQNPTNAIGSNPPSIPAQDRGHGATAPNALDARILVVSVSGDLAGQYIPLMNSMFAAQSLRIPIDVLKLSGDSVLLQQVAHTTSGIFITPAGSPAYSEQPSNDTQTNGTTSREEIPITLLPGLFQSLLPTNTTRHLLNPPKEPTVDFRAACFCHRRVVDLGFVCSICLSIFCDEGVGVNVEVLGREAGKGLTCPTCGSGLVLAGRPAEEEGKKKKKKKKREEGAGGEG